MAGHWTNEVSILRYPNIQKDKREGGQKKERKEPQSLTHTSY